MRREAKSGPELEAESKCVLIVACNLVWLRTCIVIVCYFYNVNLMLWCSGVAAALETVRESEGE